MKYRKLRIAWSVAWGMACVLLVLLWVRSYWMHDAISFLVSGTNGFGVASDRGRLTVVTADFPTDWIDRIKINKGSRYFVLRNKIDESYAPIKSRWEVVKKEGIPYLGTEVHFPHWFAVLLTGTIAVLAWLRHLRWRFSLRTLLIATTLVAVALGFIVWATK